MTISNHITLADIHRMPVGQIAALPATELAWLQDEADEALREAKLTIAWLDGAIALKYGDRAEPIPLTTSTFRTASPSEEVR
jgi:hypothetical protein